MIDIKNQILLETQQMLANANSQVAQHSANGFILNKLFEETQKQLIVANGRVAELEAKVAELTPKPATNGAEARTENHESA